MKPCTLLCPLAPVGSQYPSLATYSSHKSLCKVTTLSHCVRQLCRVYTSTRRRMVHPFTCHRGSMCSTQHHVHSPVGYPVCYSKLSNWNAPTVRCTWLCPFESSEAQRTLVVWCALCTCQYCSIWYQYCGL